MNQHYHFRAKIQIFRRESGGPKRGDFSFPASGFRAIPLGVAGVHGLNSVGIHYTPDTVIPEGEEFEANCGFATNAWEKILRAAIHQGTMFHLWDGRNFASGVVLEINDENFDSPRCCNFNEEV